MMRNRRTTRIVLAAGGIALLAFTACIKKSKKKDDPAAPGPDELVTQPLPAVEGIVGHWSKAVGDDCFVEYAFLESNSFSGAFCCPQAVGSRGLSCETFGGNYQVRDGGIAFSSVTTSCGASPSPVTVKMDLARDGLVLTSTAHGPLALSRRPQGSRLEGATTDKGCFTDGNVALFAAKN